MGPRTQSPPPEADIEPAKSPEDKHLDQELDEELDDTFPASDPLPWSHQVD
jgi:hypothetical protein